MKHLRSNQRITRLVQSKLIVRIMYILIIVLAFNMNTAISQQQQYASQYVNWNFDKSLSNVWNIDQQVWIPVPNHKSFWPLEWKWVNYPTIGGYLGLFQEDGQIKVRFSLWNAIDSKGSACRKFGGEGIGETCSLLVEFDNTKFYRYRVWRLNSDSEGQWWGGWLIESDQNGIIKEHLIGKIKVPKDYNNIEITSIKNFAEYYGDEIQPCEDVPLSLAGFTPPAVNYRGAGTGKYKSYSVFGGSTKSSHNICVTGKEDNGSLITPLEHDFGFAQGVFMYLGGKKSEHIVSRIPQNPKDMPDN